MQIKTLQTFLGIPKGEIGGVVNLIDPPSDRHIGRIEVKFPSKSDTVILGYPSRNIYEIIET